MIGWLIGVGYGGDAKKLCLQSRHAALVFHNGGAFLVGLDQVFVVMGEGSHQSTWPEIGVALATGDHSGAWNPPVRCAARGARRSNLS